MGELVTRPQTTAAALYSQIKDLESFAEKIGDSVAAMIGCPLQQGRAMTINCIMEGMSFREAQWLFHYIDGKPTMKYQAMLARFRDRGGKYTIVERSSECAHIILERDGDRYELKVTWQEMEASRWPWRDHRDHKKGLKDNWSTPTDRRIMMFARVVSESMNSFAPDVTSGLYTPEEITDMREPETQYSWVEQQEAPQIAQVPVPPEPQVVPEKDGEQKPDADAPWFMPASNTQAAKITRLCEDLRIDKETQRKWLDKRGVTSFMELQDDDAEQIIEKLSKLEQERLKSGN